MDLAIVMVTFQNTKLGLSSLFHIGEEIRGQGGLHPEGSHESRIVLSLPEYTCCSEGEQVSPTFQTFM